MQIYKRPKGENILEDYLNEITSSQKVRVLCALEELDKDKQNKNKILKTKPLRDSIFELKVGKTRIAYMYYKNDICILHIFTKETKKTTKLDMNLILKRAKSFS